MTITRDQLVERLAQLQTERGQILANLNAYNGAIQECERMIGILDTPSATETDSELKIAVEEAT